MVVPLSKVSLAALKGKVRRCTPRRCQVLILSPTRELAQQTEKVILAVGDYLNIQAHACIGGKSLGERFSSQPLG